MSTQVSRRPLRGEVTPLPREDEAYRETRQLTKPLAEITDVIVEIPLPAEHRDEDRLRAIASKYDSTR
jgi:hypothetical protein